MQTSIREQSHQAIVNNKHESLASTGVSAPARTHSRSMAGPGYPTPSPTMATTATPDSTNDLPFLNISRLLARLEQNLLGPGADLKTLRRSEYQRMRVGANIDYARANLVGLEKSLRRDVKDAARRHEMQTDLTRKTQVLKALEGVLEDVSAKASGGLEGDDSESEDEGEGDLLVLDDGEDVEGSGIEQWQGQSHQRGEEEPAAAQEKGVEDVRHDPTTTTTTTAPPAATTTTDPTSTLRSRHQQQQQQPTATTTAAQPQPQPQSQNQTKPSDQALSSSRLEQESLTDSLVTLATQLKSSSTAFHTSLENEKSVLDRAVDGLDATTASMNAAEKRMGMLRKMTEGKGWWGRMMLYLWILGLWIVAILIVFLGPKLRF